VRIISLLPSATEIVFALGLGDQLEGVTFECDHPPEARGKPVVSSSGLEEGLAIDAIDDAVSAATADGSPLYRLDERRIAEIAPDLILTQDLCRVCAVPSGDVDEALGRLGCTAEVLSLDPHTLDEVIDDIERVGSATGTKDMASVVTASLRARLAAVDAAVSLRGVGRFGADAERAKVLVLEWIDPPWGPGHWIPDMVERAGGESVLGNAGGHADATSWEAVTAAAPDIVVVAPCGYHLDAAAEQARAILPRLADTPAGRAGEVWAIDADAFVVRPGPRVVGGVELLSWIIGGAEGDAPIRDAVERVGALAP
jgi:iron complex transport system substrate-binding protein